MSDRHDATKRPTSGLRLVGKGAAAESFGGYDLDETGVRHRKLRAEQRPGRLPSQDVEALCAVFGGLESEMGLGSSMGAQIAQIASAPKARCGHIEHAIVAEWGDDSGEQRKVVLHEQSCRRVERKKRKTTEKFAIVVGPDGQQSFVGGVEDGSQNVLTSEPEPRPVKETRFAECGACGKRQTCPDCGECRRCGSRAWQSMNVHGGNRTPFNPNAVSGLEARAWGVSMTTYRQTRDALLRMVDKGLTRDVVVLSRMYGGEASAEHSRRWPVLGDVVVLATMTDAVVRRADEMTHRLQRQSRATSFTVATFEALEAAMRADNARASGLEIKRQAERLLEHASAAYLKERQNGKPRKKSVVIPWKRFEEGEDVD